ncbi:non-ribosomal peptide synthetase [Streptomyces goshikiensis]|uniref:non-ribosomal peptide synthetase n=1 Tax=Streptomyces goshikiensis TaxID=1942 RepID=UPI002E121887|nr:non-ribosomal peptide synthetase [Streptomyces goshikiensis]WSR97384.1 amino acid adenylation domain-containing protein [Streptomyces goshikiensis]
MTRRTEGAGRPPLDEVVAALSEAFDGRLPAPDEPVLPAGADSMTVVRLALALEDRIGAPVPLARLREGLTTAALAELAAEVRETATAGRRLTAPSGDPGDAGAGADDAPFSPTPLQQAYLVGKEDGLVADAVGCHHYREFAVADLDVARLRRAWLAVRRRHPMLDCELTAGGALRPRPARDLPIPAHPAGHDPAEVRARLSRRRYTAGDGPLYEVEATALSGGGSLVHLAVDGVVCDGRSLQVLLRDWWRAYDGSPAVLAAEPAPAPFAGFAGAVAREATGERYAADLRYWERRLAALPPGPGIVRTPARGPGDVGGGPDRRPLTGSLDPVAWAAVRAQAARRGVTATALLLAEFAAALAGAGAGLPFTLVLTTSDRARMRGAEDTVGTFTSTLVFPVSDPDPSAVHRLLAEDLEHATVPGVAALRQRRGDVPDLPVVFTAMLGEEQPVGGFATAVRYAVGRTSGVALDHQVWEADGALHYRWDVVEDAFAAPGAQALLDAYTGRLRALARVPRPAAAAPAAAGGAADVPLNDLQQAYLVARELGPDGPQGAGGCRVLLGHEVADLDLARLEKALERLVDRHPVLAARVDAEHGVRVPATPVPPAVRELELTAPTRTELLREPYAPGAGHLAVRVGRGEDGADVVFLSVDLALIDARSIHLVGRELMRLYAEGGDTYDDGGIAGDGEGDVDGVRAGGAGPDTGASPAGPAPLDAGAAREHWRRRVAGLPPGPRLAEAPDDGARTRLRGTVPGWRAVVTGAAAHGCSPDALLLAAYARALSPGLGDVFAVPVVRWTDGSDAARPAELTALSWVTASAEGAPLLDLARRYDAVLAADRTADAASGLAELRRSRRAGSGMPVVYTSVFDLDAHPLPDGVSAAGWLSSTPGVALDCVAVQDGDVLEFAWDALPQRLPEGLLDEAFARFAADLAGLAELTGAPVEDPAVPAARWNDTARPFPAELPVQVLIEDQVRVRPADVAVRWAGGALTYEELDLRANRLAWTLREAGVGRGDMVGVSVRRGPDMVVAVLGILKAGGAYLPVLPSLPRDRAQVLLTDAAAAFLLHDSACPWAASVTGVRAVDLDAVLARPHRREERAPEPVNDVDDLAYVIFTSGSTGRPKGVSMAHRPLLNLFEWARRTFALGPGDLGLSVTSLGFDLSVFDILGLLSLGAALYVADEEQQRDPRLLSRVLREEPVTFWNSAPTTLANLAPEFPAGSALPGGESLRLVFLSGDYTPLWLPDRLREAFPGATLVSLGGATEAAVWSNYFVVDRVDPGWRSVPYGRPLDNCRYYVLDAERRPVPVGEEGDLYIAGACLADGYYRQPELTAERFVTGEFPGLPETRMYSTGDRARYAPDGLLHFLGRRDGQVKVRGFRVELQEIEHRLRTYPGVGDVVVLLRSGGSGEDRLVAYVLPDGAPPAAEALRAHAAAALPDYMVPSAVGFVARWPATANGKLDRDALPWPVTAAPAPAVGDVEPIAALFGELLDLPPVDPHTDLWELGATSFTMVRASRILLERYGREVAVSVLLADPTVAAIAAHLAGPGASEAAAEPVPEPVQVPEPEPVRAPEPVVEPVVERTAPARVDFFAADDRARFKEGDFGQRPAAEHSARLPLAGERPTEGQRRWRASRRPVAGRRLGAARLGELLRVLARTGEDRTAGALYASAGDTYAVQVYVLVRGEAVDGLAEGAYYYRPREHALEPVGAGAVVPVNAHVFYNRPFAAHAAAEIYLVGEERGIEPLYGAQASRYLALESGHMAQLLMQQQVPAGVALCPVGDLRQGNLAEAFALGPSHTFQLGFLCAPLDASDDNGPVEPLWSAPAAASARRPEEVAVVGMAGRFPGAAGPDALWRMLAEGRSALAPLPAARAAALGWTGRPVVGGFLDALGPVDLRPLRISPAEAAALDPQLRLLLPTVWQCLEQAGHTPRSLTEDGGRVGVFVASMWDDHLAAAGDAWERGEAVEVVDGRASVPHRLSHAFGWQGPSLAVDTSCSSSLTALHLAVESLRAGECDSAVVAGVNLVAHRRHLGLLDGLGLLSAAPDGPPRGAYDEVAPGWCPGEAVGAVLLRRAGAAARDGDRVHGVLETSWSAHAGGGGRFGAPGPAPLVSSLNRMLSVAGLDPAGVSYVESAAAGAGLADAAEIAAFTEVLAGGGRPVPMGTLKPNIGHAEAAAGMAQLMKVLLQLRHGRIAPTLLSDRPNPLVDWANRTVVVPREALDWAPSGEPRRAIVNAVGSGGSYGHLVVRDAGGTR